MTETDKVNAYQAEYNKHWGPEYQKLLQQLPGHMQDGLREEDYDVRGSIIAGILAAGKPVDEDTMYEGRPAYFVMTDRTNAGISNPGDPRLPTAFVDLGSFEASLAIIKRVYPPIAPDTPPPVAGARGPIGAPVDGYQLDGKQVYNANMPESAAYQNGAPYQGYTLRISQGMMIGSKTYLWLK